MLKEGVPIGRLFGISIRLHYSWFVIFALTIWGLSVNYFPSVYPDWTRGESIGVGVVTSLLFFASLLAHELMHSLVAQRSGIPVKAITLFIFGGVAQISAEPQDARTEFRIAVAGPLTSLLLGGMFWGLRYLVPQRLDMLAAISFWLGWINILLAVFNLVPGFPLDGGRVLRSILWWRMGNLRKATHVASHIGQGIGFLFIFGGVWLVFNGEWSTGIWLGLIGWFLTNAATSSYRQMVMQLTVEGHLVNEVISTNCASVAPETSIERLINDYIVPTGQRCFMVVREGITLGLVSLQEVKSVLRDMRERTLVSQVMRPLSALKHVSPDESLSVVLNILTQDDVEQVPVMLEGQMVGLITRESILSFISQREHRSA